MVAGGRHGQHATRSGPAPHGCAVAAAAFVLPPHTPHPCPHPPPHTHCAGTSGTPCPMHSGQRRGCCACGPLSMLLQTCGRRRCCPSWPMPPHSSARQAASGLGLVVVVLLLLPCCRHRPCPALNSCSHAGSSWKAFRCAFSMLPVAVASAGRCRPSSARTLASLPDPGCLSRARMPAPTRRWWRAWTSSSYASW